MTQSTARLWPAVRPLAGLVFPPAARPGDWVGWSPTGRAVAHVSVFVSLAVVLLAVNSLQPVADAVGSAVALPLAYLTAYAIGWAAVWVIDRPPPDAGLFPDLDAAWDAVTVGLIAAGKPITDGPVYLLLGRPAGGYGAFARAAGLTVLTEVPADRSAPVKAIACREMTFLCLPGAGGFGPFAGRLVDPEAGPADPYKAAATMDPRQALTGTAEVLHKEFFALLAVGVDRPLTGDENARMKELADRIQAAQVLARRRLAVAEAVRTDGPARMATVCRKLVAARAPHLPADGALALLPWAALATDEATAPTGPLLAADLVAARAALGQRLPVVTAVCDLEEADGFAAFRKGFSAEKRRQRIGQRLPMVPAGGEPDEYPRVLELTADWVRANVIPAWAVKFVRVDWPPPEDAPEWVPADNRELFRFAAGLYSRGPRLGRLLAAAFPTDGAALEPADRYPLLAGCYLSATGRTDAEQGFVGGVVQRLGEVKGSAGWLPATAAADRAAETATVWLAAAAGGLMLIAAGVLWLAFGG